MKPSVLIIIPTYNAYEYAAQAIRTAFEGTCALDPHVIVLDDASPAWLDYINYNTMLLTHLSPEKRKAAEDHFVFTRYAENGGLTRSWNGGLRAAISQGMDYAVVTNSDVIFPPGWDLAIVEALEQHDLVGPLTNAPGSNVEQYVGNYSLLYNRETAEQDIGKVQDELHKAQFKRYKRSTLNGFCMAAKVKTWRDNMYDAQCCFAPRNDFNSKGERNPTPLMTLNEYELQRRWHGKGLTSAIALGSYVFHYRAVSRGDKHKQGDWVRKDWLKR